MNTILGRAVRRQLTVGLIAAVAACLEGGCAPSTSRDVSVLADSLKTRPIPPEEASLLQLDSAEVRLGLNFSYQRLADDDDVALVTRVMMAAELPYETLLKLDSLGLISPDQTIYLITRRALVRGADSAVIAQVLDSEPVVWHQSLPPEVSNYCVVPNSSEKPSP